MNKFENYLYKRLPNIYREEDGGEVLKRFLEVLESAFNKQSKETEELLNLIDIDNCPSEFLPYLCANLGVRYEPSIPDSYQRRFLKNSVELNKRKGTESAIKYLARELAGADAEIDVEDGIISVNIIKDYEGKAVTIRDQVERRKIENYIKYYIPVFFKLAVYLYYSSFPTKIEVEKRAYFFSVKYWICNRFTTAEVKGGLLRRVIGLDLNVYPNDVLYPICNTFVTSQIVVGQINFILAGEYRNNDVLFKRMGTTRVGEGEI